MKAVVFNGPWDASVEQISDPRIEESKDAMKAEFLAHHYARRLRPRAHYSMGWLPAAALAASRAPQLVNTVTQAPGRRRAVAAVGGIDRHRTLPRFADQTFPGWEPPRLGGAAIAQTHCHQHAIMGYDADQALLRAAGVDVDVLDAGCCGLAGNFGFEAGHYGVSLACAERALLPAVRKAPATTLVLADGFSCRTQIEQAGTGRTPVYLAQVLARDGTRGGAAPGQQDSP